MKSWSIPARTLILLLLLQAAAYYAVAFRSETTPDIAPLSAFPVDVAGWTSVREFPLEQEVQDVLRADDTVNRVYADPTRTRSAAMFIAYFKTQRYGQTPHSPKNCLPGAGWEPARDRRVDIAVPGREQPIHVNEYVIQRGNNQSLVLYWYQAHNRVIASEFTAKFWLVADAIRYRRSDTALVRLIVPVAEGGVEAAERAGFEFTRAIYPAVVRQLPR